MEKQSKRLRYGHYFEGAGAFDDESDIPVVRDPDTGEEWLSTMLTGVNTTDREGPESSREDHRNTARDFADYISEWNSNSLPRHKDVLDVFISRYAKAMEDYKSKHGRYPKQRVIGHSRGGGGAIELMRALNKAHPEFPQFDEFIGLDPYDYPMARTDPPVRGDKKLLARKSVVVRPRNRTFFGAEGGATLKDKIKGGLSNLFVVPATPVNPLSKVRSASVAIPDANHTTMDRLMAAAVVARKAKNREELRKLMKEWDDRTEIESVKSPDYDDGRRGQIYEKAASILRRSGFF